MVNLEEKRISLILWQYSEDAEFIIRRCLINPKGQGRYYTLMKSMGGGEYRFNITNTLYDLC